ncbi:MAG: hypothetical protein ACFFD1_07095 [Candidatus Thorarchaeota archaeon]
MTFQTNFKAHEYINDIYDYMPLDIIKKLTNLTCPQIKKLKNGNNIKLTKKQELKIIKTWATCIYERNKEEEHLEDIMETIEE